MCFRVTRSRIFGFEDMFSNFCRLFENKIYPYASFGSKQGGEGGSLLIFLCVKVHLELSFGPTPEPSLGVIIHSTVSNQSRSFDSMFLTVEDFSS